MPSDWPYWWNWELEITPHLLKRMIDRDFSETELREMLQSPAGLRQSAAPGRFVIHCQYNSLMWEVVVEPHEPTQQLLVITAYARKLHE